MSLHQDPTQTAVRRQKRSLWTDAWRRMRRSHTAVIGMILFALIVIVCFSAPLFSDYDAQVINSDIALIRKYPVEGHPLGTDELGRDLLLRILWGGRTSITIALACNPKLLIADEPTTALDVTIQAQVLELMKDLKEKYDTSMIMITHDLGIVSEVCDKVAIIYAGEVVEYGSLEHIYRNPQHPYTNGLFGSLPDISKDVEFLSPIEGLMPDPAALPSGCKFNPRCKYACPLCAERAPVLTETEPGHFVRCLIYENALDVKEVVKYE